MGYKIEGDFIICGDCKEKTLVNLAVLESPYAPRDHEGRLLTKHKEDCGIGKQQTEVLSWQHMGIGWGL